MHMHTDHFDDHQFWACEDDTDCSRPRGGREEMCCKGFSFDSSPPFFWLNPPPLFLLHYDRAIAEGIHNRGVRPFRHLSQSSMVIGEGGISIRDGRTLAWAVLQCSLKVYFRTRPIDSCYTQGSFDLLRPHDGGESRARKGWVGEVVSMRALAVLLIFCSVVDCLYSQCT